MPLFFFIIGFVLVDSGFRGNAQALFSQFASDAKGFVAFGAVIVILGAAGTSSALRPIAKGLLALIFIVFFVRNGNQIVAGIQSAVNEQVTGSTVVSPSSNGQTLSSYSNSSDSNFQSIESAVNSTASGTNSALSGVESGLELAGTIAAFL